MLYCYGNRQITLDGPGPVLDANEFTHPIGVWTHLQLKDEKEHGPTPWQTNTRTVESLTGIRNYRVKDQDGEYVINGPDHPTRPNRDARIYVEDFIKAGAFFGINIEPIPHSRWGDEAELAAFDRFGQAIIRHIRSLAPGAVIGAYYPWLDWHLLNKLHEGTITPEELRRMNQWWGMHQRIRGADGRFQSMCFFDMLHVLMVPFYGYADIDPRTWLPHALERVGGINKDVWPHLWYKHKHRTLPGKPHVEQPLDDFEYVCETTRSKGYENAVMWLTGSTQQDYDEQRPYIEIARNYFNDAA